MSNTNKEYLVKQFAQAWRTLNSELIIETLDKSFRYDSQWCFETLDCHEYIDYIRCKFQRLRKANEIVQVDIVADPYMGGTMLKLTQQTHVAYYRIKENDGRVIKGDLCMF